MILNVSRRSLARQPFAYIALMQSRLLGELGRSNRRAVGHRFVKAEAVTKQNARAGDRGAQVAYKLAHELVQFVRVWLTHGPFLHKLNRRAGGMPAHAMEGRYHALIVRSANRSAIRFCGRRPGAGRTTQIELERQRRDYRVCRERSRGSDAA